MWQNMRFERLRMLAAVALARTGGNAEHERHFGLRAAHVMPFGGLIADLVGRHQREIEIHQFHHRPQTDHRQPDARAANARLGNRRVENAVAPEGFEQTFRRLERAAVIGHVLAVKQHAVVAFHFLDERLADGVLVGDFAVDALDFRQRLDDFDFGEFGGDGFAFRVGIHVFDHVLGGRVGGGGGALGGAGVAVADGSSSAASSFALNTLVSKICALKFAIGSTAFHAVSSSLVRYSLRGSLKECPQ